MKTIGLLLTLLAIAIGATSAVKIPVTVYYEALCPDSAKFINEQVYPALKSELKDHVDVQWVPFGKSTFHTQGSDVLFSCHHGPNECFANKVHACAIDNIQANSYQTEYTRESLTLEFINCMMKVGKAFPDNVYTGEKCARDNHISIWENIHQCANSTEGSQLLKRHGDTTMQFQNPLKSVPTVVFKNQYDADVNTRAQNNFMTVLCNNVPEPKPKSCVPFNAAVSLSQVPIFAVLLVFALCRYLF